MSNLHYSRSPLDDVFDPSWRSFFERPNIRDAYFKALFFSRDERNKGKTVYPKDVDILKAFRLTPLDDIKVVILGQDVYYRPNQATGLAFAVPNDLLPKPPSLRNIITAVGAPINSNLESWAEQGILLLNTALTVEEGKPGSHIQQWKTFTDLVIKEVSDKCEKVVFCLWGQVAASKEILIDCNKHTILKECHPSPYNGSKFVNAKPFEKINKYVQIDWFK